MASRRDMELRRFPARSASMTIPIDPSYETDKAFISHTGPLRSDKANQFARRIPEKGFARSGSFAVVPIDTDRRDWMESSHGGGNGNVHLMRSGPLGMCNNPDCTTCPAAYKTKRTNYKGSTNLDSKNFLVDIKGPSLANLPVLAFEGGTRRNIPKFEVLFFMPGWLKLTAA